MTQTRLVAQVFQDPRYFIAFGFGSGLMPIAPGTWGTLAALPLYWAMSYLPILPYMVLLLAFFVLGVWVSDKVTYDLGQEDYSGIVWDEIVGYLLTMVAAPSGMGWALLGFLLFRVFDILKPFPISYVDTHVKGGLGIMLDDVLAALPACALLQATAWWLLR